MGWSAAADLEEWRATMNPRLEGLRDVLPRLLPPDLEFDFGEDALKELERGVLDWFPDGDAVLADTEEARGLAWRAVGYLGEALMRVGGGEWGWADREPVAQFDPALGVEPFPPLRAVVTAADRRTGHEFTGRLHSVEAAADRLRAREPGWTPQWDDTLGLDQHLEPVTSDHLTRWLAERAAAFEDWVARYGEGYGPWDFSPESLDRAGELVLARFTSEEEFDRPEHRDFVEGATWYVGEVIRQVSGTAEWNYRAAQSDKDRENVWIGIPFLRQTVDPGIPVAPRSVLTQVIKDGGTRFVGSVLRVFQRKRHMS